MNNLVNKMKDIRVNNNDLWMRLLEIALESNPEETKKIIKQIASNDNKVKNVFMEILKRK